MNKSIVGSRVKGTQSEEEAMRRMKRNTLEMKKMSALPSLGQGNVFQQSAVNTEIHNREFLLRTQP